MLNEGNQIHNFISSSGSGTVINYGSGSDFLTSYSSGSGSTSQKIMVPTVPVPVPQHCHIHNAFDAGKSMTTFFGPKWHLPNSSMPFHMAKKVSISRAQNPPTCPSNGFARIKIIMYRALST